MRRFGLILLLALASLQLYALTYSMDAAVSYGDDMVTGNPVNISFELGLEDFSFYAQSTLTGQADLIAAYDFHQGKTLVHRLDSVLSFTRDGGYGTLGYTFHQDLAFGWFTAAYALGIQVGLAWSPWSQLVTWSLSPMVEARIGADAGAFDADIFLSSLLDEKRSWKAIWAFGLEAGLDFNDSWRLYARSYASFAEVLMNDHILIDSWAVKVGLVFRGGEA